MSNNLPLTKTNKMKNSFIDSRNGKIYKTVKIGTQTWMAENFALKANIGCWAYDNDERNVEAYGYLYDWKTANNLCPTGCHLPTETELSTFIEYLGGIKYAGGKLKEEGTNHWLSPNNGATNESGFTALPSGFRSNDEYKWIGEHGFWWSSSEQDHGSASCLSLNHGSFGVAGRHLHFYKSSNGLSVRYIKD